MSKLWKKANFPSIEELAREVSIKKRLTIELSRTIQALQSENVGNEDTISEGDAIENVCTVLEAIFIHGLKTKFSISAVLGSSSNDNKMPEVDFWSVAQFYSHKNVLSQIAHLQVITTDIGRCRAWLRLAINDGLISSYVDTMTSNQSTLKNYYDTVAYLRDREEPDIMKQLLEGLSIFTFQLAYSTMTLNVWNDAPLVFAGIWTPPLSPQPVMPAVDVMQFFNEQESKTHTKASKREITLSSSFQHSLQEKEDSKTSNLCPSDASQFDTSQENCIAVQPSVQFPEVPQNLLEITSSELEEQEIENSSKVSSTDSVPDFISDIVSPGVQSGGNRLLMQSGWSSEFEFDKESQQYKEKDNMDSQSFDSLLQSYNKNMSTGIFGTPETTDTILSRHQIPEEIKEKSDCESSSVESKSPDFDYEIVPRTCFLSLDSVDERTKQLLSVIGKICPEKGLDVQKYQCNGCGCYVGMIYGKAYLCSYDGFNYCSDCHANEESLIPARIVHNWDFKKYCVAKHTKLFLDEVEQRPLLNFKVINPLIYTAIEEMVQAQTLRRQLTFLRSYMFTCKESVAEDLRKRIWPREYLYEHVHLYSVSDLIQVSSGVLQSILQKVINFAKKHVLSCQLCSQKGFICEICNNSKVIYPFDLDTTYHCDICLSVYHSSCMETKKFCPKCERKRRRQEIEDSSWQVE